MGMITDLRLKVHSSPAVDKTISPQGSFRGCLRAFVYVTGSSSADGVWWVIIELRLLKQLK